MLGKPLLLFDMDGTLIKMTDPSRHSQRVLHHASYGSVKQRMKELAADYGVPVEELAELERMAHIWNAARAYADHYGFPDDKTRALMGAINGPFMEEEKADHALSVLIPGTVEALTTLRNLGYEMALVTTASRWSVDRILGATEYGRLGRFFTHTVTRDDCSYVKPCPKAIEKTLRLHGRDDFVYIGDSDHDAEAAKAAGGTFILINTRGYDQEHVKRLEPEAVITGLSELPDVLSSLGYA
ncbi:HAD family hydrolase [Candidatus Bathyarchaeota archaeon]|nr:HAD family hydrolase [Candidatus Bathyarchaeota archaeon]